MVVVVDGQATVDEVAREGEILKAMVDFSRAQNEIWLISRTTA